jgi:hypothetical protein
MNITQMNIAVVFPKGWSGRANAGNMKSMLMHDADADVFSTERETTEFCSDNHLNNS